MTIQDIKNNNLMSEREREYVEIIKDFLQEHGYRPSYVEIGNLAGVTRQAVNATCKSAKIDLFAIAEDELEREIFYNTKEDK